MFQSAAVLISVIMLRSDHFSKVAAYAGIAANGIDLIRLLSNLVVPGNPADMLMAVAGPLYPVWFILVALSLLKLGRTPANVEA
jgi:hypothetical protein